MRNTIVMLLALGLIGLGTAFVRAADEAGPVKITGVVIDQMCAKKVAAKDDPQKEAAAHEKSCCLKCGGDSGYAIMTDGKITLLSKDSGEKVKEYLSKDDSKTSVTVSGSKQADGSIKVDSITAAEPAKS